MIILLFLQGPKPQPTRPNPKPKFLVSAESDFSDLTEAGRPSGSTDVHHCACVHVGRPLGSTGHLTVLSVCLGRPGGRPMSPNGHISDR